MENQMEDFESKVREMLDSIRYQLQADGGDLEVVDIKEKTIFLKLVGHCGCCPHAQITLKEGIEAFLRENLDPEIVVERA